MVGGGGSVTPDLQEVGLLEGCTGSDASGASLRLEPTIFNCTKRIYLCVICCMCSDTHAQVFQESPGVPLTPQLVLPLQDCCAFRLVSMCTTEEDVSRHRVSAMYITILGIPGWEPTEALQPKT